MALPARLKARSSLREFDLIRLLRQRYGKTRAGVIRGIGDDAAVVASKAKRWNLLTTDLLAEGVHFDARTATFTDIGYRAGTANLSDIAAMGGTPEYVLVALAIPRQGTGSQIVQLFRGLMAAARPHRVLLLGGDISASNGGWFLSVTVAGFVAPGRALLRSGARVGDSIYVTGTIGDALAGLLVLKESRLQQGRRTPAGVLSWRHRRFLIRRHLRPTARISIGRWLSTQQLATSAIDLSDGLSGDLRHICQESHVGAEIDLARLPLSSACRAFARATAGDPHQLALTGGEDYELLFTVSSKNCAPLERMAARGGMHLTHIGTIRSARSGIGIRLADGRRKPLPAKSYEHFR